MTVREGASRGEEEVGREGITARAAGRWRARLRSSVFRIVRPNSAEKENCSPHAANESLSPAALPSTACGLFGSQPMARAGGDRPSRDRASVESRRDERAGRMLSAVAFSAAWSRDSRTESSGVSDRSRRSGKSSGSPQTTHAAGRRHARPMSTDFRPAAGTGRTTETKSPVRRSRNAGAERVRT